MAKKSKVKPYITEQDGVKTEHYGIYQKVIEDNRPPEYWGETAESFEQKLRESFQEYKDQLSDIEAEAWKIFLEHTSPRKLQSRAEQAKNPTSKVSAMPRFGKPNYLYEINADHPHWFENCVDILLNIWQVKTQLSQLSKQPESVVNILIGYAIKIGMLFERLKVQTVEDLALYGHNKIKRNKRINEKRSEALKPRDRKIVKTIEAELAKQKRQRGKPNLTACYVVAAGKHGLTTDRVRQIYKIYRAK
jgi:hypothetical protein